MSLDAERDRLRKALLADVPTASPGLEERVYRRLLDDEASTAARRDWKLPLAAALIAGTVVATLLITNRLVNRHTAPASHSTIAVPIVSPPTHASPPSAAVDSTNCRLPVVVTLEAGPPAKLETEAGFVDTRTGRYTRDDGASVAGLPGGGSPGSDLKAGVPAAPTTYSNSFHRWLPVRAPAIAPDGHSYVWVRLLPPGSNFGDFKSAELHLYDLVSASDRTIWSYPGSITVDRWDATGLLVNTVPPKGGALYEWLIAPDTGSATQQPAPTVQGPPTRLPGDPSSFGSFSDGGQGKIYRFGSRTPGDQEWVFFESAPGQRVTIYRGTQGDATGFDPYGAMREDSGIWFGDYDHHTIWRWQQDAGLRKVTVVGLPTPITGYPNSNIYVTPAGLCS